MGAIAYRHRMAPLRRKSPIKLAIFRRVPHMPLSHRRRLSSLEGLSATLGDQLLFLSTNAVSGEVARQIEPGMNAARCLSGRMFFLSMLRGVAAALI